MHVQRCEPPPAIATVLLRLPPGVHTSAPAAVHRLLDTALAHQADGDCCAALQSVSAAAALYRSITHTRIPASDRVALLLAEVMSIHIFAVIAATYDHEV
jgi:hypothetical protein